MMSLSSADFSEIIHYPWRDPNWFSKLCGQGAVLLGLSFFIIGLPFLIGYGVRCTQLAIEQKPLLSIVLFSGMLGYLLTLAYSVVLWFVHPAYMPLLATGRTIRDCLKIKQYIWPYIKTNFVAILIGLAIGYLAGLIGSAGLFVFLIGGLFTLPFAITVSNYTNGVIYRHSPLK
ncbi:MAG: hypothetical protein HYV33_01740 [Candidatus Kerfeldbacteria bacterium]|nr:hypothetical protein [Candidatus Kerfeldbacteria bacterium]